MTLIIILQGKNPRIWACDTLIVMSTIISMVTPLK